MSTIFWVIIAIGGLILFGVLLILILSFASFTSTNIQPTKVPLRLILSLVF